MKDTVIQFFKNLPEKPEEQFNEALELFKKAMANDGQFRFYNRVGYTKTNLETLKYDLKKAVHVTDAEIRNAVKVDIVVDPKAIVDSYKGTTVIPEGISVVGAEEIEKRVASAKVLGEHQLGESFTGHTVVASKEEVFTKAPEDVKTAIKLRDEFPFLNDVDCPDEFHILTGKKFTSYYAWLDAHKHLMVHIEDVNEDASPIAMTDEEVSAMALNAVENFEVNQSIWRELNHYKEKGKILGKHPVFIERQLTEAVTTMTNAQAAKRLKNLDNYIRRDKRNLEKAEKANNKKDTEKFADKIVKWQTEEKLIKAKHNL